MTKGLLIALTVLYPFAVAFGQHWLAPHWLAVLLVAAASIRLLAAPADRFAWLWLAGALVLAGFSLAGSGLLPLKFYPVLVNLGFLVAFGSSLIRPPTIIERIARMQEPDLPPAALPYIRKVTVAWCVFFVVNGSIAAATALWASDAVWGFYNGFLAYLASGAMFAIEWLFRQRMRRRIAHG